MLSGISDLAVPNRTWPRHGKSTRMTQRGRRPHRMVLGGNICSGGLFAPVKNPDRYAAAICIRSGLTVYFADILSAKSAPVRAAKGITDLRPYPDVMRFSLNVYFFLLFDVFFAVFFAAFAVFFAFFVFFAMFPSVIPKVGSMQNRHSICIHSDYTIIAKLIPRASNRVNVRRTVATCGRAKRLRDASRQCALPDQDVKKSSCVAKPATGKPRYPLGRSMAWWISQTL